MVQEHINSGRRVSPNFKTCACKRGIVLQGYKTCRECASERRVRAEKTRQKLLDANAAALQRRKDSDALKDGLIRQFHEGTLPERASIRISGRQVVIVIDGKSITFHTDHYTSYKKK